MNDCSQFKDGSKNAQIVKDNFSKNFAISLKSDVKYDNVSLWIHIRFQIDSHVYEGYLKTKFLCLLKPLMWNETR